ncbi:DUF1262 family protein [Quillaja saponaria]|uniref:DUF1262 family protein n=1 Tax=Quillaja saponaria TaxID=32244 RepID=A0AAD7PGH0_QUISA|nr:DUF1262 family protein [Quillaja saponaria]
MYVTRPLSLYKKDPAALSLPTPEGPNSGYVVIQDEAALTTSCFGLIKNTGIKQLPFPQNMDLIVSYVISSGPNGTVVNSDKFMFIPSLNQPLSSNQYYVIQGQGKHQGYGSKHKFKERGHWCFPYIKHVKPRPLDPSDIYQQVEIIPQYYGFHAKSIAVDGLSADFNFPSSSDHSEPVVIGKWYCPFMFVKEGIRLKDQMKMSRFYEMTLEQRWEKIFSQENISGEEKPVLVDVVVQREVAFAAGREAVWDERNVAGDGLLWYKSFDDAGGEIRTGLSLFPVERMKWEQGRVGWVGGDGRVVRLVRVEEFGGGGGWKTFGCYVLWRALY